MNEIHVESLQDKASSSNSSKGGSIGGGYGSGSKNITASYNQAKGNSDSAWVNETSKLLIGNAQNDADLDAMGVKNVTNIGGVIANATKNSDGTLTDHGKLNYSGELELKDIEDHNYNSSSGFNVSTNIGIPQGGTKEGSTAPKGSTTIGLNSSGQETEQLTKATMGQGTVKNAADTINRDINNTQEITRDQTTGMLDGSVTVDHRLLTESGRAEIIKEQKGLPENLKKATQNLKNDVERLVLKLPDSKIQNQILISINQMVGGDLIVDAYKDFLNNGGTKEEFFVVANNSYAQNYIKDLADANEKIQELESKGYSLEQILNTSIASIGDTNVISVEGQHKVNLTTDTTIGMQLLTASYGLSKGYSDFQQEMNDKYGVEIDPETLSVVIGTILTGPAKTVANVLLSIQYGEYIQKAKDKSIDLVSTSITAISYGTDTNVISTYTNPELREQISKESVETQEWSKDVSESKEGAKFLTNIIAGIVVGGVGKGIVKGKEENIAENSSNIETKVPDYVTRNDHDFSATENYKGKPKAHINENGDLVPPNIDGTGSIQSHIRGGNSENTPYISTTDPSFSQNSKDYGGQQIKINTQRLQEDIDAGKVSGTKIITHTQIRQELQSKVDVAQARFDANPSKKNKDKLADAQTDLSHAIRDGECLIKGCVPSEYLKK